MDHPGDQRRTFREHRRTTALPGLLAVLTLILAAGTTGCGAGAKSPTGSPSPSRSPRTSATPTTAAPPTATPPTSAQMRAALLTAKDLGPSFSASDGNDSSTVTGCQPLADMLNSSSKGQQAQVRAEFAAEGLGPFLGETLTTRRDQADLAREYDNTRTAMARCQSLSFLSGGTKLTFSLSPISFGGPGSAAARLDGTYQGVQINGYVAIDKVGPVVFAYYFFQVESGSSQLAYAYYKQADAKVRRVLHADGTARNAH